MLRMELKKIILSPQYLVCVLILYVLLMMGTVGFWKNYLEGQTISMLTHFLNAWEMYGNVYIAVPVLVSVPVTFLLHDEINSGMFHFTLVRAGKSRYIANKLTAGVLSGFFMVITAEILFTITLLILIHDKINFYDQQNMLYEGSLYT